MATRTRKGLSKAVRFSIFARDGFTCRYCGSQSDSVRLVVDHIIPVAEGGTNDEANLITACEPCNQGKGKRTLEQSAPTEIDRLRMLQEVEEQKLVAQRAREAMQARAEFRQIVVDLWCDIRESRQADSRTISVIASYVQQYGLTAVADWISIAHAKLPDASDSIVGRYVSGIRRQCVEEGSV